MEFWEKISALQGLYPQERCRKQENACCLGVAKTPPPLADHILYAPMPEAMIGQLVGAYRRQFPQALLTLYRRMNGCDLFWTTRPIGKTKRRLPVCMFSVYGVPWSNSRDQAEPFNISLEDLNRPQDAPESWLKFGRYCLPKDLSVRYDLFLDTETGKAYAVENGTASCTVRSCWESLDACLCAVFDLCRDS